MAVANVLQSFAFFEAKISQKSVEAQVTTGKSGTDITGLSIRSNEITISAFAEIRSTISDFRKTSENGLLKVEYQLPQDDFDKQLADGKAGRDFDLMLRLISKDEDDYQRLKNQFTKLMDLISKTKSKFSQDTNGNSPASSNNEEDTSSLESILKANLQTAQSVVSRIERRQVKIEISITTTNQRFEIKQIDMQEADPLVLDLAGNGPDLTNHRQGALFDINADGILDRTSWIRNDDALLAYDRNGNGIIDDGRELFGDQNGAANGFLELAKYDENHDGKIDIKDSVFKALKLYRDLNGNGRIEANELSTLEENSIVSLQLQFTRDYKNLNDNKLILKSTFQRADGSVGTIRDVIFSFTTAKV